MAWPPTTQDGGSKPRRKIRPSSRRERLGRPLPPERRIDRWHLNVEEASAWTGVVFGQSAPASTRPRPAEGETGTVDPGWRMAPRLRGAPPAPPRPGEAVAPTGASPN